MRRRALLLGVSWLAVCATSAEAACLATGSGGTIGTGYGNCLTAVAGVSSPTGVTLSSVPGAANQYASFGASIAFSGYTICYAGVLAAGVAEGPRYPITTQGPLPAQIGATGAGSYQIGIWDSPSGGTQLALSSTITVSAAPTWATPGSLSALLDASAPALASPAVLTSLADSSGNARNATLTSAGSGGYGMVLQGWKVGPRYNGLLSGLLDEGIAGTSWGSYQTQPMLYPFLANNSIMSVPNVAVGSGQAWSLSLVFSNSGRAQADGGQFAFSTWTRPILAAGGVVIASLTNNGSSAPNTMTLFPGRAHVALSTTVPSRFTSVLTLRNTPGAGVDVWINGTQVATGIANPFTTTLNTALFVGSDGANSGKFIFHTLAVYAKTLTAGDIANLLTNPLSAISLWQSPVMASQLGARKGGMVLATGQSNMNYLAGGGVLGVLGVPGNGLTNAAWLMRAQLGMLCCTPVYDFPSGNTDFSGTNFYGSGAAIFSSTSGPSSSWPLGAAGTSTVSALQWVMAQPDLADLQPLLLFAWSENNSQVYGTPIATTHAAALRQYINLVRTTMFPALSGAALVAAVPMFVCPIWAYSIYGGTPNGLGIGLSLGIQTALAANDNIWPACPQMQDVIPLGATWNGDGSFSNGTGAGAGGAHMDPAICDAFLGVRIGHIAGIQAVLAGYSQFGAVPVGIPRAGGPKAISVSRAGRVLTVILVHDGGTDVALAFAALSGAGWTFLDGVTADLPGSGSLVGVIQAIAAVRVNATTIQVTLASTPSGAAGSGLLYYSYGMDMLGGYFTGGAYATNAVTDNFASLTKPAGWDVGAALGMPLSVPLQPVLGLAA